MMTAVLRIGIRVACGYLLLAALLWLVSERMIFPLRPRTYSGGEDLIRLHTRTGDTVVARYLPADPQAPVVLYSHGNGEDLGTLEPVFARFVEHGYGVFGYDYPGFGLSSGTPTEKSTCAAIGAAYAYMTETLGIEPSRIILHGRSVGSGPTLRLAVREPYAALVLESAFTSIARVHTRIKLLPFDRYPNLERIRKVHGPVLVMHGMRDHTLPPWNGKDLFRAAPEPKYHLWVEDAGHNDLLWKAGEEFWEAYEKVRSP